MKWLRNRDLAPAIGSLAPMCQQIMAQAHLDDAMQAHKLVSERYLRSSDCRPVD